MQIVSIGEVLWDVFGEKEFLGGAPLNFSAHLHRLDSSVTLLSAVGADARGNLTLKTMRNLGLTTEMVHTVAERPTGTAIIVTDCTSPVALGTRVASSGLARPPTQP